MKKVRFLTLLGFILFALGNKSAVAQEMLERIMTVQELAESLQKKNIQSKIINSSLKFAEARIDALKINSLPDISSDLSAFYLSHLTIYDPRFKKLQTVDLPNFGNQFNVKASQLLFAGGKINKSIAWSKLSKTLIENQLNNTEQSIKLNATELYLNLYSLQNQKRILENKKKLNLLTRLVGNILIDPTIDNNNLKINKQDKKSYRQAAYIKNPQINAIDIPIEITEKKFELTKTDRNPILAAFEGYNANRPQAAGTPIDLNANT